ncbi:hypothetical protein WJX84_005287, partial [Apatococcus fuscideae]
MQPASRLGCLPESSAHLDHSLTRPNSDPIWSEKAGPQQVLKQIRAEAEALFAEADRQYDEARQKAKAPGHKVTFRKQTRRKIAPTRIAAAEKDPVLQQATSDFVENPAAGLSNARRPAQCLSAAPIPGRYQMQAGQSGRQASVARIRPPDEAVPGPVQTNQRCSGRTVLPQHALSNGAASGNSPMQGMKSWRQAVDSPTTAWIRQASSPVNSSNAPSPPEKVSISRASLQACSLTTVSVASSLEAQASSTEAVVTGLSSGIEASSPEAPSPGDASSPGPVSEAGVRVDGPAEENSSAVMLESGWHAHIFACRVLERSGGLATSIGLPVIKTLAAHPALAQHSAALLDRLQAKIEQLQRSGLVAVQPSQHQRRTSLGSFPGLLGLSTLTSDAHAAASQDERRRISNREHCRDDWLACLRAAAFQGGLVAFTPSPQTSSPNAYGLTPHGSREAAFTEMQKTASAVLRRLRPDNARDFAELVTEGILQAAATGEALLDDELAGLARRDPSRFQRLNQRLQASQGPRQPRAGTTPPSSGAAARPATRTGPSGYGAEGMTASLAAVDEFPAALRLHAMFLEAADSYRLNQHLLRCMVAKLRRLTGAGSAPTPGHAATSEKLAMQCALALFISHLAFPVGAMPGEAEDRLPLDVIAALQGKPGIHCTVPGLGHPSPLVHSQRWGSPGLRAPPEHQSSPPHSQAAGSATACRRRFSTGAFIVRALLEDLLPRLGLPLDNSPELSPN